MQKQSQTMHIWLSLNNKAKKNSPFIKSIDIIIIWFNRTIIKKNKFHTKVLHSVLIEYARKFERNTRVFRVNFLSKSIIQWLRSSEDHDLLSLLFMSLWNKNNLWFSVSSNSCLLEFLNILIMVLPLQTKSGIFWLFPEFFLEYDRKDF